MRATFLLVGIALLPAHAANAQQATPASALPTNVSISQRPRPDYEPIGGRVGSFFLYPRLDVTTIYTSNLRAQEDNPLEDVFVDIRPSARITSLWSRHSLEGNVYYERTVHARFPREDFSQYGGTVTGRYDYGRGGFASLTAGASRVAEPRSDINSNTASRSPVTFSNLTLSGSVSQEFARLALLTSANVNRQDFNDTVAFDGTPLFQGFRDNTNYSGLVEGRLLVGGGTRVIARAQGGGIRYKDNPFGGFDRNSNFYRVEGGVGLNFSELLSGNVTAGFYRQDNADARLIDSSGVSFSADLLYNPTPLTSVRLFADRSIEPGGSTVTSGNVRGTVALTVEHELRPNLILTGNGRYSNISPQGPIGGADEYNVTASATYLFNRRFRFNGSIGYAARKSEFFPEFKATTATLGVSLTL